MASWGLLDDKEENELHKSRLLNVEEKPFKRVTKRLNTLHSIAVSQARQAAAAAGPPESSGPAGQAAAHDSASPAAGGDDASSVDLAQLKEDITLDFAAFDSSIARLQFLLTANGRERERYAAERERILGASQSVRDRTAQLRAQLDRARATLEQRRRFDELADAIANNPALRPRAEQEANLRKLEDEIAELEAESKTYAATWQERRDQFARIMDESMRLRRLIRDEKEEVERREGMDDEEGGQSPRPSGLASGNATPRPESGLPPKSGAESGEAAGTPRPLSTTGGRTPARESPAPGQESQSFLKARLGVDGSFSHTPSQMASREGSAEGETKREQDDQEEGEDVEMGETKGDESEPDSPLTPPPADDTPRIVVDGRDDRMDTT